MPPKPIAAMSDALLQGDDPKEVLRRFEARPDLVVGRWALVSWYLKLFPVLWIAALPLLIYTLPAWLEQYFVNAPSPQDLTVFIWMTPLSCVPLGVSLIFFHQPVRFSWRKEILLFDGRRHDLATLTVPRMVKKVMRGAKLRKALGIHGRPVWVTGIEVRHEGAEGERLVLFDHEVSAAFRRRFPEFANKINDALYEYQRAQAARAVLKRQASLASPYRDGL